ncbi:MAG: DUF805 domain-containing protein [Lentisphaeria bacterium]
MNWETWLHQGVAWINIVIFAVAVGFSASWSKRKGKALLVTSVALSLAMLLTFQILNLLIRTDTIEWRSPVTHAIHIMAMLAGLASNALLLSYIFTERGVGSTGPENMPAVADAYPPEPMTIGRALFSFQGRMRRRDYWLKGFLVLLPLGILNNILAYGVDDDGARVVAMVIGIASMWPGFALVVKRLHDRNRSGWFAATLLIPFANIVFGIWILIEVWFLRGTVGPNRFGPDPVQ